MPAPPSLPCFASSTLLRSTTPSLCTRATLVCSARSTPPDVPAPTHRGRGPKAAGIGLSGGVVGSLIGAGGGVALTPLLTSVLRLPQHAAHGTSLCVVVVTAAVGAARYAHAGHVALPAAACVCATAVLLAPVGARAAGRMGGGRLKLYFGVFLLLVACSLPVLPALLAGAHGAVLSATAQRAVMLGVGAVTGFLSGLLGIGGGTIAVPVLVLAAALPQKTAQGTALLAMILPSALGAFTHWKQGNVVADLLPGLAVGAVVGGVLGSSVALHLPEATLRIVCSGIFGAIGMRYILQDLKKK